MRLRVVVPGRGRGAGLRGLARVLPLLLLLAAFAAGCGKREQRPRTNDRTSAQRAPAPPRPIVLATGLTEANPQLLYDAASHAQLAPELAAWRDRLVALHPAYVRVPVYWSKLQPDPAQPAALDIPADGCLRGTPPCGASSGLRDQLAAIASLQRASRIGGGPEVEVVIAGVPDWAADPAGGCERSDAGPAARPINAAGLTAYRALIAQFAELAREQGAKVRWWSPWNEPNHPAFISPQRSACSADSPSLAPAAYAQLVRAAREALDGVPGDQQLVLGEMAGTTVPSPHRSTVQEVIAALPDDVVCASRTWSQHDYATVTPDPAKPDPVTTLQQALDARPCTRGAHIWVTETGVGGPQPGGDRPSDDASLRAGCRAQDALLRRWAADPRVDVALQYTFREDTAYPVGLADAGLTRMYPTYDLWMAWGGTREPTAPPPPLPPACA
jgi:hypothetical protein